jgi:outer membrane protein assembly factor BamB
MKTNSANQSHDSGTASDRLPAGPFARWTARIAWLGVGLAGLGITAANILSSRSDFAATNILTFVLSVLIWVLLIIGFKNSTLPRSIWRTLLVLPMLGLAVFLSMYGLERLDGELVPRFRFRWATRAPLPVAEAGPVALEAAMFQSRSTDYPQFLGPNRDGKIETFEIDADWNLHAPFIAWKRPVGDGWSGFAVQGDVAVTMEQRDEQEWVTAYDVRNGALLWKYVINSKHTNLMGGIGPRSTPSIFENRVYACSAVSRFVCLNLENGEEIWAQELLSLSNTSQAEFEAVVAWGRSASPLCWNSQVIIALGGNAPPSSLISFDATTGAEQWRAGNQPISYSSPTLMTFDEQEQIVLLAESSLRAFDPVTQAELWSVAWPGSSSSSANVSQPVQVDSQHVFMSKGYGTGCQLVKVQKLGDHWETDIVWKNELALRTKFTTAVAHQGFAYGLSDGILECVDLSNGEQQWKRGRYKQGQLMLVGSNLLITSEQGQIVVVAADPKAFRELAKLPVIGDVAWNTPALSGNRLLVRNSDEAACILLPLMNSTSPARSNDGLSNAGELSDGELSDAEISEREFNVVE